MTVKREYKERGKWYRDIIAKLSEAVKFDAVYLTAEEAEDSVLISNINKILATKELVLVTRKPIEFESGDIKYWIGDLNYTQVVTALE